MRSNFGAVYAACALAALVPSAASAQIIISEIMYDPSGADAGREWVEVFNGGTSPIDLTKLKFFENGTNHKIIAVTGNATLGQNAYAVIADNPAKFRTDWPTFGGALFDSAFSLSNTGEVLSLHDASSTNLASASYERSQGGVGDGNSLNRDMNGETLIARAPSPGTAMSAGAIPPLPKVAAASARPASIAAAKKSPAAAAISPASDVPDSAQQTDAPASELAASSAPSSSLWWIAAVALGVMACGALVAARHFGKSEWNIEESSE